MFSGVFSDDVDGWLNALVKVMKTQKSRNALQVNIQTSLSSHVCMFKLPVKVWTHTVFLI